MFKLKTDRQTWITVTLPDPDGKASIRLKAKMLDHAENARRKHVIIQDQVDRLRAEAAAGTIDSAGAMLTKFVAISEALSPEAIAHDMDLIVDRVTDWQDIGDEKGEPLPFTPNNFRALLNSATWVVKTIRDALTELDDNGRVKN